MKRYIKANTDIDEYRGYKIGMDDKTNKYYVQIKDKTISHEDLNGLKSLLDIFIEQYNENYRILNDFKRLYNC